MHNIQHSDDNYLSIETFSENLDFVYYHSLKETDGITEKSLHQIPKDDSSTTSLENFSQMVNFLPDAYDKLRAENVKQVDQKSYAIAKSLRDSTLEYYYRVSTQFMSSLQRKLANPYALFTGKQFKLTIRDSNIRQLL